jgi:hypothetical protein
MGVLSSGSYFLGKGSPRPYILVKMVTSVYHAFSIPFSKAHVGVVEL